MDLTCIATPSTPSTLFVFHVIDHNLGPVVRGHEVHVWRSDVDEAGALAFDLYNKTSP